MASVEVAPVSREATSALLALAESSPENFEASSVRVDVVSSESRQATKSLLDLIDDVPAAQVKVEATAASRAATASLLSLAEDSMDDGSA